MHPASSLEDSYDVAIVGGGPAASTVATLLAKADVRVVVFEKEQFPRLQVGESLLPANLPIFDRLGCHGLLRESGLMEKPGVTIYDDHEGRGVITFAFPSTRFQPSSAYHVVRASFDDLLLKHAGDSGASVFSHHSVNQVVFEANAVALKVKTPSGDAKNVYAQVLVDASGRASFVAGSLGRRVPIPGLGKVALFAHFQGMQRDSSIAEGNARLFLIPQGWLWWFSFADGTDSVGAVLHSRVVKDRGGSVQTLFDEVLAASPRVTNGLAHAEQITPVQRLANFSYKIIPCVGNRYVAIGDAAGFIDPIFSTGVFLGMRSGELAADAILAALRRRDFSVRHFRRYERQLRRGTAPFLRFIRRFYEPAFLDIFFTPHPPMGLERPVLWVLSGAAFDHRPLWVRFGLAVFFGIVNIRNIVRWAAGLPVESRGSW